MRGNRADPRNISAGLPGACHGDCRHRRSVGRASLSYFIQGSRTSFATLPVCAAVRTYYNYGERSLQPTTPWVTSSLHTSSSNSSKHN